MGTYNMQAASNNTCQVCMYVRGMCFSSTSSCACNRPKVSVDDGGMSRGRGSTWQPRYEFIHGWNIVSLAGFVLLGPTLSLPLNVIT